MAVNAHTELMAKITVIIVEQLGVEESEITLEANLVEDLDADSLDMVEMVMSLEEQFDIEIPDEDAKEISTFVQVVAYVEKKLAEKAS